jgi:hypothetical protein
LYREILQASGPTDFWRKGKEYAAACLEEIRPKKYRLNRDFVGYAASVEQVTNKLQMKDMQKKLLASFNNHEEA